MNKLCKMAAGICAILAAGCASHGQVDEVESTTQTNQKILRENEARLHNLENSISALNTQVAQLNNRVYEVRTRSGQKTSMTVVPVSTSATPASKNPEPGPTTPAIAPQAKSHTSPAGRKIDPNAKPAPLPATPAAQAAKTPKKAATPAGASGSIGKPENVAGASGQLAALPPEHELEMPPTDVPSVPSGNTTYSGKTISAHAENQITANNETVVPVPMIPANDLSLPPEHPDLASTPPAVAAQPASAPAARPTTATATRASTQKGEEAAYQAALKAARSGNTTEGIRLFQDFLQKYPNGRYTANADYWIGECLYAQGKYQDALAQFQTVNNSFPKHHKNADALLKAGMSMTRMGDKAGAQEKYRQILTSFPNSEAARRVRAMGIK